MCYTTELFGTSLREFSMNMNEDIHMREMNTKNVITAIRDALKHVHNLGWVLHFLRSFQTHRHFILITVAENDPILSVK